MRTIFLSFLDKEDPPHHSFVDGMLARALAQRPNTLSCLVVSRGSDTKNGESPHRYYSAICLPKLFRRRGLGRLGNFFLVMGLLRYLIPKYRARNHRIVLFIRNDPVLLLACSISRKYVDTVIYQNSYPHIESETNIIKKNLALLMCHMSRSGVDSILAVSPKGLERVQSLFPSAKNKSVIPLLADSFCEVSKVRSSLAYIKGLHGQRFIYIGMHDYCRRLDLILEGISTAVSSGAQASFVFVGGSQHEIDQLRNNPDVRALEEKNILTFIKKVSRPKIFEMLEQADIGISLIPPTDSFREASPTKIAEYMGAGLAVIASRGISLQEEFVKKSDGGFLVDWDVNSISNGIIHLARNPNLVKKMRINSIDYASKYLRYDAYLNNLEELM